MKLSKEVISVLDAAMCEGSHLYLAGSPNHQPDTPRLDRKLYEAVNKALAALGGKWKGGKAQAHVFDESPADAISDAIVTGDRRSVEFRKFVTDNGGEIEMLPEESFKESGTMVSACVVTIPKK